MFERNKFFAYINSIEIKITTYKLNKNENTETKIIITVSQYNNIFTRIMLYKYKEI